MNSIAKLTLFAAKNIQKDVPRIPSPPEDGKFSVSQSVIPFSYVKGTRGYIEKVVNQLNGSYENGWYDSCAVMIRRLVETLIIEVFEAHSLSANIQNSSGDFFYLSDLISKTLNERSWNLGRNCKLALPKLKDIGDKSAHSRRFNAHKRDIDQIILDLRTVVQELIYLAALK